PRPIVLGHEGAGVVEAVGAGVTLARPGDHVVCSWNPSCGHCFYCDRDQPILCEVFTRTQPRGQLLDGASRLELDGRPVHHFSAVSSHAEFCVVHETSAVPVPREIPFDRACLLGCGVMTGVGAATRVARIAPGATVVVVGAGAVGLNAIQGAVLSRADVIIAADVDDRKLALARTFGATHTLSAARDDVVARVRDLTDGHGADVVLEAAGKAEAFRLAVETARPGGASGDPPRRGGTAMSLLQGIVMLLAFLIAVWVIFRGTSPIIVLLALAIAWTVLAGAGFRDLLANVLQKGGEQYASTVIVIVFGAWFGQILVQTGIAESMIRTAVELAGDRPIAVAWSISLITAVLFTSIYGVGAAIAIGVIAIPIMLSLGIPARVAAPAFTMAIGSGNYLNPVEFGIFKNFFKGIEYAQPYFTFYVIGFVVYLLMAFAMSAWHLRGVQVRRASAVATTMLTPRRVRVPWWSYLAPP